MTIRRVTYAMLLGLGIVIASGSVGIVRADMLGVDWFGNAYVIDETTAQVIASAPTGFFQLNSLARDSTGQFYTVGSSTQGDIFAEQILLSIDPATGIATPIAPLPFLAGVEGTVRALAFSPDDVLYATLRTPVNTGVERAMLYTIDVTTGAATLIGSTGSNNVQGMAFSPDGILYGLDGLARLGIIDVTDGTITPVGDAPQNLDLNSLGFRTDGVLYAAGNNLSELYTLNPDTGVATLVGIGEFSNLRGLDYIPGSSTLPPRVACAVDVMTLDPPNGDMVDIGLEFDVRAGDDPSPTVLIAVFANEGDGDDASFTVDGLTLRAERSGNGTGRVYLILVAAIDNEGQAGIDCCTVVVPHDSSTPAFNSVGTEADLAELTCRETGLAPEGFMMIEAW